MVIHFHCHGLLEIRDHVRISRLIIPVRIEKGRNQTEENEQFYAVLWYIGIDSGLNLIEAAWDLPLWDPAHLICLPLFGPCSKFHSV